MPRIKGQTRTEFAPKDKPVVRFGGHGGRRNSFCGGQKKGKTGNDFSKGGGGPKGVREFGRESKI